MAMLMADLCPLLSFFFPLPCCLLVIGQIDVAMQTSSGVSTVSRGCRSACMLLYCSNKNNYDLGVIMDTYIIIIMSNLPLVIAVLAVPFAIRAASGDIFSSNLKSCKHL